MEWLVVIGFAIVLFWLGYLTNKNNKGDKILIETIDNLPIIRYDKQP